MSLVCPTDETGLTSPLVVSLSPFVVSLSNHERPFNKTLLNVVEGGWANGRTNGPSTSSGRTVPGPMEYPG